MHDTGVCAQDPNAGDEVTLLVLDDPGMPAGMTSSGTICIPRELAAGNASEPAMCKAADSGGAASGAQTRLGLVASRCSKAKLVLSWKPGQAQGGQTFKVCVVAKDSSTACVGKGPPASVASSRGSASVRLSSIPLGVLCGRLRACRFDFCEGLQVVWGAAVCQREGAVARYALDCGPRSHGGSRLLRRKRHADTCVLAVSEPVPHLRA